MPQAQDLQTRLQQLTEEMPKALEKLVTETAPLWGIMTAQHMVEHLTDIVKWSLKGEEMPVRTKPEHLPKYREVLLSDQPFPKNIRQGGADAPAVLKDLKHPDLESAKAALKASLAEFSSAIDARLSNHPSFGELTFQEWLHFHIKHLRHHFEQFGLMPETKPEDKKS